MTAYGPVQCDQVVQGLLAGEALTLPCTNLASLSSGDTPEAKARQDMLYMHAVQFNSSPEQIRVTCCLAYGP